MKSTFFFLSTIALLSAALPVKPSISGRYTNFGATTNHAAHVVDTTAKDLSDTQFLITAYNTGIFEIKASKLASRMTSDKKVRQFAAKIRIDQEAMDKDLLALLIIKGCTPPTRLSAGWKPEFKYLNEWMGKDFDRKYVAANMEKQNNSVALYTGISVNSKDADIRRFAIRALAGLEGRNDSAQSLLIHINKPPTSSW